MFVCVCVCVYVFVCVCVVFACVRMSVSAATFDTHSRTHALDFPLASSSLSEGLVFAEGTALVLMLGLAVASTGLQLPTGSQPPSTRRALLSSTAAVAALALPGASFAAVKPCKSGAQNCFSTAGPDKNKISQWVWPSDMSRADATAWAQPAV